MISLSGIRKTYRTAEIETIALDGVGLEIAKGEFVAVTGPSGCGKSSLLNLVGLIDRPSAGSYVFDGHDVSACRENQMVKLRRDHVGFIFQSFNLLPDLSVQENIELPLLYQKMPRGDRKNRVREVLELVGLNARATHRPAQLSGGQQQRVAVARALVGDPKLILADEPTGNLDSKNGEDVMDMLRILNEQGATIMMVTHSSEYAARAHRTIEMIDGHVVGMSKAAAI
jgi:putative ABC transport system ATP-binding protein